MRARTRTHQQKLSVVLIDLRLLSAHTQAAAYLIGETAAEKLIAEYK